MNFFSPLNREFYLIQSDTVIEYMWGFLGDAVVKNPPANAGDTRDMNLVPGSGRPPGEGNGNQLQYSCLDHPHGQRSLVGFSQRVTKSRTVTERVTTHNNTTWNFYHCYQNLLPNLRFGRIWILSKFVNINNLWMSTQLERMFTSLLSAPTPPCTVIIKYLFKLQSQRNVVKCWSLRAVVSVLVKCHWCLHFRPCPTTDTIWRLTRVRGRPRRSWSAGSTASGRVFGRTAVWTGSIG